MQWNEVSNTATEGIFGRISCIIFIPRIFAGLCLDRLIKVNRLRRKMR